MRLTWEFLKIKVFWAIEKQKAEILGTLPGPRSKKPEESPGPDSRDVELNDIPGYDKVSVLCFTLLFCLCFHCSPSDFNFRNPLFVILLCWANNRHSLHKWLGRFLRKLYHVRPFGLIPLESPLISTPLLCVLVSKFSCADLNT